MANCFLMRVLGAIANGDSTEGKEGIFEGEGAVSVTVPDLIGKKKFIVYANKSEPLGTLFPDHNTSSNTYRLMMFVYDNGFINAFCIDMEDYDYSNPDAILNSTMVLARNVYSFDEKTGEISGTLPESAGKDLYIFGDGSYYYHTF